jgi:predicted NACHT family NTPase
LEVLLEKSNYTKIEKDSILEITKAYDNDIDQFLNLIPKEGTKKFFRKIFFYLDDSYLHNSKHFHGHTLNFYHKVSSKFE